MALSSLDFHHLVEDVSQILFDKLLYYADVVVLNETVDNSSIIMLIFALALC